MRRIVLWAMAACLGCGGGDDDDDSGPGSGDSIEICRPSSGPFEWVARIGATGGAALLAERVVAIAALDGGDVVIAGTIAGPVDLGGGALPAGTDGAGFLARLGPDAAHRWSTSFEAAVYDVEVASGELVGRVVPFHEGTVDLGGGPVDTAGSSHLVARWTLDGDFVGAFPVVGRETGTAAATPDGGVVVGGRFSGPITIGTEAFEPTPPSQAPAGAAFDGFVAGYDGDGGVRWAEQLGAGGFDAVTDVAVDEGGDVYVVGHAENTVDLGGGPLTSEGERDAFVLALDAAGGHRWSKMFGDNGIDVATAVTAGAGHAIVGGVFRGTVDFGRGPVDATGGEDGFLVSFDGEGNVEWVVTFGTEQPDGVAALALGGAPRLGVAGRVAGPVDLGGGPLDHVANTDGLVAAFGLDGGHLNAGTLGGSTSLDDVGAAGVAADGSVYGGGQFTADLTVGDCRFEIQGSDGMLAKLRP